MSLSISTNANANNLITSAQHKLADAAQVIARLPIQKDEVGSSEFRSSDITKPILSLKEAELETSAAVKLLQADKKTIGSLFDTNA